jgi:predicted nucleotidyltransferase
MRIYNKSLCPKLWDNLNLNSEVRDNLLKIARDFYDKTTLPAPIHDVTIMGSIANFNWNPDSDIDIHIMIDFNKLQMPKETSKQIVKSLSSQWNSEHDIIIKGHNVEINFQDISDTKPHVTGIYSLVHNKWVRTPQRESLDVDKDEIKRNYNKLTDLVKMGIELENRDYLKAIKSYIDSYRQFGLDKNGELSNENIVFKLLRNKGILSNLTDSINKVYDKKMSVKEKSIGEVTQKDIKTNYPEPSQLGSNKNFTDFEKLSLDNLKSLRDKIGRILKFPNSSRESSPFDFKYFQKLYFLYNEEIKRRLKYINAPVAVKQLKEVNEKDIKSRYPQPHQGYEFDDLSKLTLDNLKSLKYKLRSFIKGSEHDEDKSDFNYYVGEFKKYDAEIKRRLKYINAPVAVKQVKEVNEKDIKSRYPQPHQQDKKRWFDDFSKLSLDNLKSLRSKAARSYLWAIKNKDKEEWAWYDQQFFNYDDEIKRRMRKINAPVAKMKEGYGAGKPEDDRLHIPDHRWQIRSKDAPKTPKMVNEMPNMSLKGRIFI